MLVLLLVDLWLPAFVARPLLVVPAGGACGGRGTWVVLLRSHHCSCLFPCCFRKEEALVLAKEGEDGASIKKKRTPGQQGGSGRRCTGLAGQAGAVVSGGT